jgi:hypothetical protein
MEVLSDILDCIKFPLGALSIIVFVVLVFWLQNRSRKVLFQQRKDLRNEIGKNAVMAPAVVLSAKNGVVEKSRMWVTFTVEVQPEGRPAFQATFKDWVLLQKRGFVSWGERHEEVGQKIWVTYNVNDPTEMILEHYDVDHRVLMGQRAFEKIYERNKIIRETGEEAEALILAAADLNLHVKLEKEFNTAKGHYMLYKVEIYPKTGDPYKAEFQALIKTSSLPKFEAGKKCYVKFDPQDRSQVCISRAME